VDIDNDMALEAVLMGELDVIMKESSDEIVEEIKKNIQEVVYNPFDPVAYDRLGENGGLLGSWLKLKTDDSIRNIEYTIYSEPSLMAYNPENFQHGSLYADYISDVRESLIDIIINGKSGPYFDFGKEPHWWKEPRDFWTPSVENTKASFLNNFIFKLHTRIGWDVHITV
jgi:hypothetical protein